MKMPTVKCDICRNILDQIGHNDPPEYVYHITAQDCIRAMAKRIENLEYELMAKKLPDALCRSSEPGPPSIPVIIPDYIKK